MEAANRRRQAARRSMYIQTLEFLLHLDMSASNDPPILSMFHRGEVRLPPGAS